jgi:hypothetical protein
LARGPLIGKHPGVLNCRRIIIEVSEKSNKKEDANFQKNFFARSQKTLLIRQLLTRILCVHRSITMVKRLADQSYYHGIRTREEIEKELKVSTNNIE